MLSGISGDYYLRLEQGRDQRPSEQVLDALARVLRLDADATAHLHRLGRPVATRGAISEREKVRPSLAQLINSWTTTPAYVQDRLTNVLAANAIATALSPNYSAGQNLLRAVFLDPGEREFRREWEQVTADGVASLREMSSGKLDDPDLVELVGDLSVRSEQFRWLWARHDIKRRIGQLALFDHPQVGPLELHGEKLAISGTDGLMLVVFHADPGTRTAESLALLASLIDPAPRPRQQRAATPGQVGDDSQSR